MNSDNQSLCKNSDVVLNEKQQLICPDCGAVGGTQAVTHLYAKNGNRNFVTVLIKRNEDGSLVLDSETKDTKYPEVEEIIQKWKILLPHLDIDFLLNTRLN
jgi:hypothetical protein